MPAITSSAVCLGQSSGSIGSMIHYSSSGSVGSSSKESYSKRNISNSYDSIENYSSNSSSSTALDDLLDDTYEVDKNEIRKILIRTLPPLPKILNPYKRMLDIRIVEMIKESVPIKCNFDGNIKQYYDLNLIIPPTLLEFVQGFEWEDRKFLNPKLNIISGPVCFSKLDSLDMICKYPSLQQVSDINSIIFIAVGKDILGVRVSDVLTLPSNFNVQIFRENSFKIEEMSLLEIIEGFSCWNIQK